MTTRWLVKTDPAYYGFSDLMDEGVVMWRDVTQPAALRHMRQMRRGDEVLVYHMGSERAVVGTARVSKGAYADPDADVSHRVAVDLRPVEALERPVSLAELRREEAVLDWELLRVPRLTVMPVSAKAWRKVLALSRR